MKKNILRIVSLLVLIAIILLFSIPYFVLPQIDEKEEKIKEENFQKFIQERILKRNAEKKIYLTGYFDPSQKKDFVPVPVEYNIGGYKMYLRTETLDAFLEMAKSAEKDGINLKIASATRNFDYQKSIWEKKWSGVTLSDEQERFKKILEYSSAPGTSRHHWGTDIDINGASPEYFNTTSGKKVYAWLAENAMGFGFCQTYNQKDTERPTGYNEEKWHWSYLPLARIFTQDYKNLIKDEDIKGFNGDEYVFAPNLDLINDYVLAINRDCF